MKKLTFLLWVLPVMLGAQPTSLDEIRSNFAEPGNAWRGKPFWSWNGDLEKEELIRQIHVMKEMGMGGFFMHSRTGLRTEYLGDKWFDLINACADEAEKLGMEAWLYDEDRWPSGLAGGLVTQYPEYRAKLLTMHVYAPADFKADKKYLALFSCRLDSLDLYDYRPVTAREVKKLGGDRTVLAFFVRERDPGSFYNGYTDVDRMSREATDYFIEITHEEYRKRCGDRLGKSIYGIFTDEPHRQAVISNFGSGGHSYEDNLFIPWTGRFADEFRERMGYDIMDKLPEIFYRPNGQSVSRVKWDYMETAQQLFLENWVIPYYQWCEENNIIFTGHFLHEDALTCQAVMQGSLMRSFEYMHYPGVDVLTEFNRKFWIGKQVQSVARQMGQPFILSELYGVTGWQFNFANHKYVGDWQALFGINLRCHHLSWYTMQGQAKRDYPASILHQSAWYKDYDYVETYYARLDYLLSLGEPVCDVLVINPVESVWSQIRLGWANGLTPASQEILELEDQYSRMFYALQGNQIDFDYGDEDILKRHAKIEKRPDGSALLHVGKASYRTVVLGGMTTIRSSTLEMLKEFAGAGGQIILAGDAPVYVDVLPSEAGKALTAIATEVPFEEDQIAAAVRQCTPVPVEAIDPQTGKRIEHIYCQVRRDGDLTLLAAMNVSRDHAYENVVLRLAAQGVVSEWDCESGKIFRLPAQGSDQVLSIETSFTGTEEHIYTITPGHIPGAIAREVGETIAEVPLTGPFSYSLEEPNVCVLDMGYVQIEDKGKSRLMEILKIDEHIRDHYQLPYRAGNMVQPWFKKKFHEAPEALGKVSIHFPFYVEEMPEGDLAFCMETPQEFVVLLNGQKIALQDEGWWVDKAIRKFSIPAGLVRKGENMLVQEFEFRDDVDLESLYLQGEFSVRLEGNKKILGQLPEKISLGDLAGQGFPFYTGGIRYRIPLLDDYAVHRKVVLEVPDFQGALVKVDPGQPDQKIIAWQPNRVEITDNLKGSDELALEVVLTRRNAFGPLHHTPFTYTTGPRHFLSTDEHFTLNYMLYPSGILENPRLLIY
jgi:hypothetical protein